MGAGCYYTHDTIEKKAFWIDVDPNCDIEPNEYEVVWDDMMMDLSELFQELGYDKDGNYEYSNGLFNLVLESTYSGTGLVIKLEVFEGGYHYEDERLYNLGKATHERSYTRIARKLVECGYSLRIASSGYTSISYNPN